MRFVAISPVLALCSAEASSTPDLDEAARWLAHIPGFPSPPPDKRYLELLKPVDACFVTLDPVVKDRWGDPVARVRVGHHDHSLKIGNYMAGKPEKLLKDMGARNVDSNINGSPPSNLVAGGCRFGKDPATSVLDKDCRAYEVAEPLRQRRQLHA